MMLNIAVIFMSRMHTTCARVERTLFLAHRMHVLFMLSMSNVQQRTKRSTILYVQWPWHVVWGKGNNDQGQKLKFCASSTVGILGENGADTILYQKGKHVSYIPPSTPLKPRANEITHDSVTLEFGIELGAANVTGIEVSFYPVKDPTNIQGVSLANGISTVTGLTPRTEYVFKVRAKCIIGTTSWGPLSDTIKTLSPPESTRLAIKLRDFSVLQQPSGSPAIYKLPIIEEFHDRKAKLRFCEIGERDTITPITTSKVVIILGATGSGKTTVINGMANYIYGVTWKDDFRFKVITEQDEGSRSDFNQAFSQTKYITSYKFHQHEGSPLKYPVTIIDKPGFGDTEGIKRDQEIVCQIRGLFQQRGGPRGFDCLDAIGFVVQAPNARLTHTQQYIMDSILSIFGKDAIQNLFIIITFADGGKPLVLEALKASNLTYKEAFKFNNSALYSNNKDCELDDDEGGFDEMFWKIGFKSYQGFFKQLGLVEPQSLLLTREVLHERKNLETTIQAVQTTILAGLRQLETLREETKVIEMFEAQINANKDFTYNMKVTKQNKVDLEKGEYVTNCLTCNFTCHYPCFIPNDSDKSNCAAMHNENCTACPMKCYWNLHVNNTYRFVLYEEMETRTSEELKTKYLTAKNEKSQKENMLQKIRQEFDETKQAVHGCIYNARNSINRLNQIAAKLNPLSTVDYIDILIQSEEKSGKPGWKQRLAHLKDAREEAKLIQTLNDPHYEPFTEYNAKSPKTTSQTNLVKILWNKIRGN